MTPVFITISDYQAFTIFTASKISGGFIMVKDTIIEEKNCFSDDSARRFMQTFQQTSFYQALSIFLFTLHLFARTPSVYRGFGR